MLRLQVEIVTQGINTARGVSQIVSFNVMREFSLLLFDLNCFSIEVEKAAMLPNDNIVSWRAFPRVTIDSIVKRASGVCF